ncbi:hypothetical protein C8Q70DRAFT_1055960 [Cubamyces menziesii]|nr:hypothetical protein C8Q70DRAFT_1055960 [Cubamyces menziesii]
MPRLPPETIDLILNFISWDDEVSAAATLHRCALAGRDLLSLAQDHLYRSIHLTKSYSSSVLLSRTLHANFELAQVIKVLSVNVNLIFTRSLATASRGAFDDPATDSGMDVSTPTVLPFHLMTKLHTLKLLGEASTDELDEDEFIWHIISRLPRLEHLECKSIMFTYWYQLTSLPFISSSPDAFPVTDEGLPRLKTLKFEECRFPSHLFQEALIRWLRPSMEVLQNLQTPSPDTCDWWTFISSASTHLRSLTIPVRDRWPNRMNLHPNSELRSQFPNYHAYVANIVAQCSYLRALHIKHEHSVWDVRVSSPALLEALCSVLARDPAPFPTLADFTLTIPIDVWDGEYARMMPFAPDLRARFIDSFLDRNRFPHFCRVTFYLWAERWNGKVWTSEMDWEECHSDLVVKTWRTAFAAFESPGVTLDVSVHLEPV